jgi:hypothetical protein
MIVAPLNDEVENPADLYTSFFSLNPQFFPSMEPNIALHMALKIFFITCSSHRSFLSIQFWFIGTSPTRHIFHYRKTKLIVFHLRVVWYSTAEHPFTQPFIHPFSSGACNPPPPPPSTPFQRAWAARQPRKTQNF